jgi:hypothetical protein
LYSLNNDSKIDISFFSTLENPSYKTLVSYLMLEEIEFQEIKKETHYELALKSDVKLDFENWDKKSAKNNTKLNGIRYFDYQ